MNSKQVILITGSSIGFGRLFADTHIVLVGRGQGQRERSLSIFGNGSHDPKS